MLEVQSIETGYGRAKALFGISLQASAGQIHCLLGRNGAGKTTTLKAIAGLLPLHEGRILLDGEDVSALPSHRIAAQRIGYVPQGRRLFTEMTVGENLEIGLMARSTAKQTKEWVLELFPRLRERLRQRAETLSGGEQQMLATARALCIDPKVLLLDEPTEGLQPSMIQLIREVILKMRDDGVAILLVEQRIDAVLAIADQVTIIENGRMVENLNAESFRPNPKKLYDRLGV